MYGFFSSLMHSRRSAFLHLTLIILFNSSCNSCSNSLDPPAWSKIIKDPVVETDGPSLQTTGDMVIYIDVSASMAGYVSTIGNTIYGKTLQELRSVASSLDSGVNVWFRTVDAKVGEPTGELIQLQRASADPSMYKGGETNIAGAINMFSQSVQPNSSAPARFHILVTDGVQSINQQRASGGCLTGSDQICIRERILELLKKGWGGCVLGVKSEFRGNFYSEINYAKHVNPYAIPYDTAGLDPDKYRPFYLYILSPDPLATEKIVSLLKERLASVVKQGGLRELALTLPYTKSAATTALHIPPESKKFLHESKSLEEAGRRLTLRVDLNTEKAGPQLFSIHVTIPWSDHALDTASKQELAELLRWNVDQIYPAPEQGEAKTPSQHLRQPELKINETHLEEENIVISATARWPQGTGRAEWRVYKITGYLNIDRQTPMWIKNQQWSTELDNSAESGSRTLFLETSLSNLWRNDVLKNRPVAEFYIRVGPN